METQGAVIVLGTVVPFCPQRLCVLSLLFHCSTLGAAVGVIVIFFFLGVIIVF
jgi:hypothetical protein